MFTLSINYIVYFLFVVDFRIITGIDLEKGDICSFIDGTQGICKVITSCQPVYETLEHGVFPENICGFERTTPLVCCKETGSMTHSPVPTNATTTTTHHISTPTKQPKPPVTLPHRIPGEISQQKCKEYAQYSYKNKQSPTSSRPPNGRTRSRIAIPQISNILECGFDKLELLDGGLATTFEFPHMALIGYQGVDEVRWLCGGTLISENFVLTAAHCLIQKSPTFVRTGLTNRMDLTNMQERVVSDIIPHPEFNHKQYYNDIGLLRVSKSLHLDAYIRPACLQSEKTIQFNKAIIATGWGATTFGQQGSDELLKVALESFDIETCKEIYKGKIGIIEDSIICAGSKIALKDTCRGDSGGPLQVYHEDTEDFKCMYDIIGVTSFGPRQCGMPNFPGVYTRVSKYIKWIEDIVWP